MLYHIRLYRSSRDLDLDLQGFSLIFFFDLDLDLDLDLQGYLDLQGGCRSHL